MTLEELCAHYDELSATNPVLAARFALDHGLFMSPRKSRIRARGGSAASVDMRDGQARVAAMRKASPPTPEQIAERLAWARNNGETQ